MNILDAILSSQGGGMVENLGSQFNLSPEQAQSAVSALVPALAAGFQRNMTQEGGLESLLAALSKGGHQRYLDDPAVLGDAASVLDGNGILGHVFGSKDVSRQVASHAAQRTGLDVDILKRMLPLVAAMVMGGLSRRAAAPGAAPGRASGPGGGLLDMLAPMLDQNRDGSMLDDVLRMAGNVLGGRGPA